MRKHKSPIFLKYLLLITISSLIFIRFVKANPTAIMYPVPENPVLRLIIVSIFFVIGAIVEYFYFKNRFSKISLTFANKNLFTNIFKVNLVTYPLTQIFAYIILIFLNPFFWPLILLLEVLVVLIEWQLLKLEFSRTFKDRIPSKTILKDAFLANLYSFLIGLIGFIGIIPLYFWAFL